MKAVYIERHGGPEVLKYGELPDPVAKPGEIVVDGSVETLIATPAQLGTAALIEFHIPR